MGSEEKYEVTLVGYGRYGNYIGPKYAREGHPWRMRAVVDPALSPLQFSATVLGTKRPDTSLHADFESWYEDYFRHLTESQRQRVVVELALPASVVCRVALQFIGAGVKHLVLPKPVVDTADDLSILTEAVCRHEVKAAIASQWYYSSIPKIIERDLRRLTGADPGHPPRLDRAVIEFSKENGREIAPAPLCELPHALQILHSAGLMKGSRRGSIRAQPYSVAVDYGSECARNGIEVIAGMDYERTPAQKNIHPEWDFQERSLYAYGLGSKTAPILWVDFWIKFSPSGDSVIYCGRYSTREPNGEVLSHGIAEDLLQQMHETLYGAFDQTFEQFEADADVLPLSRYGPIGRELVRVHELWTEEVQSIPAEA